MQVYWPSIARVLARKQIILPATMAAPELSSDMVPLCANPCISSHQLKGYQLTHSNIMPGQ